MTIQRKATIGKELITLATYPFSDPDPIPQFGRSYPYFRFDGYAHDGQDQQWEMIVLENDYIKLWINPAVGGKIWGAIEKSTGKEFIYFNHSAKFRDVATRGPWTSGGMEFNFGIIGHAPTCSSPVDHSMRENTDGSVSCFIGATDWPSLTNWIIEISLKPDAAFFTTRCNYYNGSGLKQSYYQWNNAGVKTRGNLEYVNPGFKRIGHDGKALNWPKDEQCREISWYDKNNFGEYKSYHLFGSVADFWGGYWHDDDFGFGHYAPYDDKPGKKIWIWGLSPFGMIWEDLLTDNDGQYCEVQSGRLFNQSISQAVKTPFKHASFLPYQADEWEEHWFPVKQTGGLTSGNPYFSFNIKQAEQGWHLTICANCDLDHQLKVFSADRIVLNQPVKLTAMQITVLGLTDIHADQLKIWIGDDLVYDACEEKQQLSRPSTLTEKYDFSSVQAVYIQAKEWERQRFYELAIEQYRACLAKDPFFIEALVGLAGLFIRQTKYNEALALLLKALSIDTYHGEANYLYGLVNMRLTNNADARDGFSIAAQSVAYRSAAYTELAKLFFREGQLSKSKSYLKKALTYNTQNRKALHLEIIIERLQGNALQAGCLISRLLQANPLDHLVHFERYLSDIISAQDFQGSVQSELPHETYLELNSFYWGLGLYDECLKLLALAPAYAMVEVWKAYLSHFQGDEEATQQQLKASINQSPAFVFPHREEDVKVLEWAVKQQPHWKLKYYLALAYIQMLRKDEALQLLSACKSEPDFYVFYLVRGDLNCKTSPTLYEADFEEARRYAPNEWRTALIWSKHLGNKGKWFEARDVAQKAYLNDRDNYYLGMQLAKCLIHTSNFNQGITLMTRLKVLPNEGAQDGRNVWRETHLFAALQAIGAHQWQQAISYVKEARRWPQNMGVGKPYEVDERLEDFFELHCSQNGPSKNLSDAIVSHRDQYTDTSYSSTDFLTVYALHQKGDVEKARQIMNNWQKNDPHDLALQWAQAFLDGDTEGMERIALIQPAKTEPMPYEILFEDRSFQFIKELYRKGVFEPIKTNIEQH